MASGAIVDFWRRRRIFIVLGLIGLCLVVVLLRTHPFKSRKTSSNTPKFSSNIVKNSGGKIAQQKTKNLKNANHVRPLSPIINGFKPLKRKDDGHNKFDKIRLAGKVKDLFEKDDYDDEDYGGDLPGGVGLPGGGKRHKPRLPKPQLDSGMVKDDVRGENNGEAPVDMHPVPDEHDGFPDKPKSPAEKQVPDGDDAPTNEFPKQPPNQDLGDQNPTGKGKHQLDRQPNQPGNVPNQPRNRPNQPVNWNRPNQPGNVPQQPGNVPGNWNRPNQPGNGPYQPGNGPYQSINGPGQSVNRPNQPGDIPYQPGNVPNQPGNGPDQPPDQPANEPDQPPNEPDQPGNGPDQPGNGPEHVKDISLRSVNQPDPQTAHQNTDTSSLYVHSSMPLGAPLNSRRTERQQAVVEAFKHAWKPYKEYAWGKDEVNPISRSAGFSTFNMGMTLVDSLDTMWLMGLEQEFQEARDWVETSLNIDRNKNTVSLFETTIRVLGGLLSAYHLSGDRVFLDKATALGTRLLPAFDTPSGIPSNTISLSGGKHSGRSITTAEAGSLQLEFRDLSRATGDPAYQKACDRDADKILSQENGMVKQSLNTNSGQFSGSVYSSGAGTDSYYEYLLKQWIQSGMTEDKFREAYVNSVKGVLEYLVGYSQPSHMAFLGKRFSLASHQQPSSVMDHLSCFYPGMLALGNMYQVLQETRPMAENLTHTCYYMYTTTPTGLAPEIFQFNTNPGSTSDTMHPSDSQNLQRPETVESLFYLYRLTKDEKYRDWGWGIFQAFEKYSKVEGGGYACLKNVFTPGQFRDRTESFFLTETLKYLYLLFEEDESVLSLNEWVFNTEAHPLPIWKQG